VSIVFINSTGDTFTPTRSGAIGTWIWEVCRAASQEGVRPLVISRTCEAAPHPWSDTVFVDYPPLRPFRGAGRLFQIQKRLTGWGHIRQGIYAAGVARAIRRAGVEGLPLVLNNDIELAIYLRRCFPDAFILHHTQNNNTCDWRARRAFGRAVNVATAVTDFCAHWNASYFRTPVRTLPSGVDTGRFSPAEPPPAGDPVINFVGRTDASKGPDLLLEAALQLAKRTQAFSLQILGRNHYDRSHPDAFQRHLEGLVEKLESTGVRVRRPGWVERAGLPDELRRAHIHCVPARWDEPFGLTTLEGMACGLATVASRTGGTPEVVGDAALLFERGAVDELTEHLAELVLDPARRRELGQQARQRALQMSWQNTWDQLKACLSPLPSLTRVNWKLSSSLAPVQCEERVA
jgi:glycosyltransferase involved in cell wall biosynthesis